MRTVSIAGLRASCLGFGCASLGSRIGPSDGLRALARAHDAGVTWFDVAPAYGGGEGEAILGRFLKGRRDTVCIATKVGLKAPPRGALYRALLPVARPLVGALKGLRGRAKAVSGGNVRVMIDGAAIRASLEASLRRLGSDHVDLFALHMPDPAALDRDDVRRALEDARAEGKALAIGVAGDGDAASAAARTGAPFDIVQIADDPLDPPLPALRAIGANAFVTHSVFGVGGALARIAAKLRDDGQAVERARAAGYAGPPHAIAAALLIDRALAANAGGVVLASMFNPAHLQANIARAASEPRPGMIELASALLR